ncbi:TorD/DmsD family molecular chaperone [Inmirania thermothiophila]|uniref:TorA maturation chaperone TorD n=1 Tax=Inmirania thermothiophila TaxID=1750597 RepID=A0A3N1Y1A9_9GAMM|nr:molecular chaperone TorD family protein [Inmirania thermothiophila]ROR32331.1 TorA maturation chaperone TorD [Inmirania thermothiophila]
MEARGEPGMPMDEAARLRGATWGLLGLLLARPPEAALLARLGGAGGAGEDALARAWEALAAAARATDPEAAEEEYHALFIGLGRGEVLPFASWYLTGALMERPLARLREDLARLGYARREEVREPEDHAAALCETMALLIADGADEATQRRFFDAHIGPWMGRLFDDLRQAPSARLYRAAGELGRCFLELEERYLALVS